jgi:ribosomal protein S18 acetylase RimI-like enzyme
MVVALTDGRVVGYGAGTVVMQPARATSFFVSALEVHSDYRRRGAGRRMLSDLIEAGFERGCEEVWLCLARANPEARALCEGLGGGISDSQAVFSWD